MTESSEVSPKAASEAIANGALLIDVREKSEYDDVRIPGSVLIPLGDLPARLAELPRDSDVVLVCHGGGRSSRATAWLLDQGYSCRNITGGMVAYAAAGHPLESETGEPPIVD